MAEAPKLTPARRQALAVLLHAERNGSSVRYSNHTTPAGAFSPLGRELAVNWPAADWLGAQGLVEPRHGGANDLRLTDAGRRLAEEVAADG